MKISLPFALAAVLSMSSCASIVSKSRYPVAISSVPPGATVVITNRAGNEVFNGVAPTAVTLKAGAGYFRREKYKITFSKTGFDNKVVNIESDVNGWYFGNILFGGFIGMLIVDPITGAMYRISEKELQGALMPAAQGYNPQNRDLRIVSVDEVPANLRSLMVPMQ